VVLLNNRADSMDQMDRMTGGRGFNPTLGPLRWNGSRDLAAVARALGAAAEQVTEPDQIRPGLERAIAIVDGGRTAMVEVITSRAPHMLGHLWRGGAPEGGE